MDFLEPASLVELVTRRLREEILSGALAPGDRLIEEQITARFGISRAPLREALRLLGQQGLVEHLPRRGVRVAELSARDVDELFGLRDVLECHAVRSALHGPVPLAGLAAALEEMDRAAAEGDALAGSRAHHRFHLELVALAGQRQIQLVYEPVISMRPAGQMWEAAWITLPVMVILLIGFFTGLKLPFGLPVGLVALLVGTAIGYRGAGQCSGLQAGGEGPRGRAAGPGRVLPRPVLLLDVLAQHAERYAADRPGEDGGR